MQFQSIRRDWSANPMREMLAGAVATFALIPEVIAFSFVAGVDPQVGLFASFVIGIVIAFTGGRSAMISAAAGSVALVAAPLVHTHGLPYLFAAGLLAGMIQILFGLLRLGVLMRFVSKSVRTGFVNALAILIFWAQMPHIIGGDWIAYSVLAAGLAIIYVAPRITTSIPSPSHAILILTTASVTLHLPVQTVADLGKLPDSLPIFGWPAVPLTLETLTIIAGPALAIAMVGLLESMMTASVVDDLTDTPSSKNRECTGLGIANAASSLFGGIAGCGMIGQTVSNVKYGGRGRLSTAFCGRFPAGPDGPAETVGIAGSGRRSGGDHGHGIDRHLRLVVIADGSYSSENVEHGHGCDGCRHSVQLNLALGVTVGVLLSGVFFTLKVARLLRIDVDSDKAAGRLIYRVSGQVFFASADAFIESFDIQDAHGMAVTVDVSQAHFWDITAVAALDKIVQRFGAHGVAVDVTGLNQASTRLIERLATTG